MTKLSIYIACPSQSSCKSSVNTSFVSTTTLASVHRDIIPVKNVYIDIIPVNSIHKDIHRYYYSC